MSEIDLRLLMEGFESRLLRVERVLGLMPSPLTPEPPSPKQQIFQQRWAPVEEPKVELQELPADQPGTEDSETVAELTYASFKPVAPVRQMHFEQTIGLKWAGWIGAVVLVIGAAFGVKFAYEQGWFTIVTPAVRLSLLALGGVVCIAAGEWVFRKINQLSAAGLFGAGVAIFFIVSYAGHAYYSLYAQNTAYVFMGISTLVGAAVAHRGGLVSIAVLSLIGGNLAPVLLHDGHPHLFGFLCYLLMLQVVALTLAALGGMPRWWTLRGFSLATTSLWFLAVARLSPWQTTFAFIIIFAVLHQGELIWSAARSRLGQANAGAMFSLLVTAAFTIASLRLPGDSATAIRVASVLSTAVFIGSSGLYCRRSSGKPDSLWALGISFALQTIALIVLAVPVALSGIWIAAAWGGLAIALVVLGRVLNLPTARRSAVGVWMLAVIDVALWSIGGSLADGHSHKIAFVIAGTAFPIYVLMGWALAAVGQLIARLLMPSKSTEEKYEARLVSTLGGAVFAFTSIIGLGPLTSTGALLFYAFILAVADVFEIELCLQIQSAIIVVVAAAKWTLCDTLSARMADHWSPGNYPPLLTPQMAVGIAIAGTIGVIFHMRRKRFIELTGRSNDSDRATAGLYVFVGATLILLWAGTMEIDRVLLRYMSAGSMGVPLTQWKQLLWTVWWMLGCCGFVMLFNRQNRANVQVQAIALQRYWVWPAAISLKYLAIDTLWYRLHSSPFAAASVPGPVMFGGILVAIALAGLYLSMNHLVKAKLLDGRMRKTTAGLLVMLVFWLGSFSIDQVFTNLRFSVAPIFSDPVRAEQVALSIFWSAFALGSIAAGFGWRATRLRYFGLALFAVTLLKVVTIDLSQVSTGYRILSFMGLGVLLLLTSVVYGKLSPILLSKAEDD